MHDDRRAEKMRYEKSLVSRKIKLKKNFQNYYYYDLFEKKSRKNLDQFCFHYSLFIIPNYWFIFYCRLYISTYSWPYKASSYTYFLKFVVPNKLRVE